MEFEKFVPVEGVGVVPVSKCGKVFLIAGVKSPRVGQIAVMIRDDEKKQTQARSRVRSGRWVGGPEFTPALDFSAVHASAEEVVKAREAVKASRKTKTSSAEAVEETAETPAKTEDSPKLALVPAEETAEETAEVEVVEVVEAQEPDLVRDG